MGEQDSRGSGEQESAAQPREQGDPQRTAEEGVGGPGRGHSGRPGEGGEQTGGRPTGADQTGAAPSGSEQTGRGPTRGEPTGGGPTGGGPTDDLSRQQPSAPQPAQAGAPRGGHLALAQGGQAWSDPDVILQIPRVKVEKIYIEVDNLDAHVSLRARLGNFLQLDVGVQAHLGTVKVDIEGVETEAWLEVRLEEVRGILDRALTTIERNPQLIEALLKTTETAVNQVGQTAQQVLGPQGPLSRTLEQVGQAAQEALGPQGPLSQTLQQATQQVGQQLGQTTQQLAQTTQQAGAAAARRWGRWGRWR
ncbi:hypothetical protein JNW88_26170, partial [Micromonospora sp. ATA32]|nr:hypothetical protein [Micromonospora sp. ATA32]